MSVGEIGVQQRPILIIALKTLTNMSINKRAFKQPPMRYRPKGMTILYEDYDIVVIDKMSGLLSMSTANSDERTAYYLLTDYVRKGNPKSKNRLFIVHRLDRDTSGVLVFAKNEKAKHFLQSEWASFEKKYYAVAHGTLAEKKGVLVSYLAENAQHEMYVTKDPKKGKLARTRYSITKETATHSYFEIKLETGLKNQIRVQLAEHGCPIVGDKKYGAPGSWDTRLALHAAELTIRHPFTGEIMTFTAKTPSVFQQILAGTVVRTPRAMTRNINVRTQGRRKKGRKA